MKWLCDEDNHVGLSAETATAYRNRICWYHMCDTCTVDSYWFEVDSSAISYPELASYGEHVTARLSHSVILGKHLEVEKLRGIMRNYEQYQMPKLGILERVLELWLKQTLWKFSDQSEIFLLCSSYSSNIPLFPYRMQLVAL